MIRSAGILATLSIAALPLLSGALAGADSTVVIAPPVVMVAPGPESVVEGTIARTNKEATRLVLTNGMELTVPLTVPALHTELTPHRSIKAYYRDEGGENIVTMIVPIQAHPGAGV